MALGLGWKVKDAAEVAAGGVVAPDERLSWGKTVGLGAQHVVAMFGATFVFPLVMGLNAQLAIMMSGIATILFLLIVQGKVPSYLGTSAAFVGAVAAIRAQEGATSADVTGAILVAGLVLAAVGLLIHVAGPPMSGLCRAVRRCLRVARRAAHTYLSLGVDAQVARCGLSFDFALNGALVHLGQARQALHVVRTLDRVGQLLNQRHQFPDHCGFALGAVEIIFLHHDAKQKINQGRRGFDPRVPLRHIAADQIIRIKPLGKGHHTVSYTHLTLPTSDLV